jgi:drug/metabolite transporter (DMT)-like permease
MTTAPDHAVFGWLYLGALAVTALTSLARPAWGAFHPTWAQWGVLAYLGVLSSALCFFWWNRGATRVNAGTLAALNNAKVPLGIACSLLFFHEHADFGRLLLGGGLLVVAVLLAEKAGGTARG